MAGRFTNIESGLVELELTQADPARIPSLSAVLLIGVAFLARVPAGVARSVVGLVSGALAVTLIGTVNCGVVPPLAVLALIVAVLPLVVKESPWGELRAGLAWGSFWLLPEVLSAWKPTATSWDLVAAGAALLAVAGWHLHTDREHPLRRTGLIVAGLLGILALQTATVPETGAPLAAGLAFGLVLLLRRSDRPGWVFAAALLVFGSLKMVGLVAAAGRTDLSAHLLAGLTLLLLLLALGFGVVRQKALDVSLRHGLLLLGGLALPLAWQWSWLDHKWPFGAAVSLGWSVVPLVFLAVGVWLRLRPLRIAGGLWLVPVFLRVLAVDLADTTQRVIAVGALSALLLLVGWGYRRAAAWLREDGC